MHGCELWRYEFSCFFVRLTSAEQTLLASLINAIKKKPLIGLRSKLKKAKLIINKIWQVNQRQTGWAVLFENMIVFIYTL